MKETVRFNKEFFDKALNREVDDVRRDTHKLNTHLDDKYKHEVSRIKDTFVENEQEMKHEKRKTTKLQEGLADAAKSRLELANDAKEKYEDLMKLIGAKITDNRKGIEAKQERILKEFYEKYLLVPNLIGEGSSAEFNTLPEYLATLKEWRGKDKRATEEQFEKTKAQLN